MIEHRTISERYLRAYLSISMFQYHRLHITILLGLELANFFLPLSLLSLRAVHY